VRSANLILVLFFLAGLSASAQSSAGDLPDPVLMTQLRREPDDAMERMDEAQKEQAKRANLERQKALQRDTDRLMQLATELKQYVDKSNENMLSISVIRKAEEIEKLAKNVKEKMKADSSMPSIFKRP
jgi:thymidylate kinase